jgi:hypothetical protein
MNHLIHTTERSADAATLAVPRCSTPALGVLPLHRDEAGPCPSSHRPPRPGERTAFRGESPLRALQLRQNILVVLDRLNARRSSAIHRVWMEQRRARGERMACPPGTGWASRSRPSASRAGQDDHASSSVPRLSPPGGRVLERASASTLERRRLHAGPARDPATPRGRRRCAPPPRAAPAPSRSLIGAWPLGPRRSEWAVARGGSDGAWKRRSRPPVPRHGRPKRA